MLDTPIDWDARRTLVVALPARPSRAVLAAVDGEVRSREKTPHRALVGPATPPHKCVLTAPVWNVDHVRWVLHELGIESPNARRLHLHAGLVIASGPCGTQLPGAHKLSLADGAEVVAFHVAAFRDDPVLAILLDALTRDELCDVVLYQLALTSSCASLLATERVDAAALRCSQRLLCDAPADDFVFLSMRPCHLVQHIHEVFQVMAVAAGRDRAPQVRSRWRVRVTHRRGAESRQRRSVVAGLVVVEFTPRA
jgi:hypothetical protein